MMVQLMHQTQGAQGDRRCGDHLYKARCASGVGTYTEIMKFVFVSLSDYEKAENSVQAQMSSWISFCFTWVD